jgi:glycosyltransferase involved in cell wall biosynthesis
MVKMKKQLMHLVIDCRMINMSGIGTYLKNIIPDIISSGEFNVTCLGYAELKYFDWFKNVKYIHLNTPILSFAEQIELPLNIPKCDVFWSPNWNIPLFPIRAKKRIVTIHDVYHLANPLLFSCFKITLVQLYMKFIKIKYKHVITVSQFSKKEIIKYTSVPSEKITVIYLAVADDFNQFAPLKTIDEDYVLFVGNVKPHKNLKLCLEAFQLIKNKKVKFYIVGKKDGFITNDNVLMDFIKNLDERIVFTGRISDDELKNYYKHAKLFLFPSTYEGFGLPILEAMKFDLPIIASRSASIPEVAADKVIYFDSSDRNDLVAKIDAFFSGKINCLTDEYENHLKNFEWKHTVSAHIKLLMK